MAQEKRSFTISLKYDATVQIDHRSQGERETRARELFEQDMGALLRTGRLSIIDVEENDSE